MTTAFDEAFAIVVGEEGGFDNTPLDPGNWTGGAVNQGALGGTKYGISAAAYPTTNIEGLTLADAKAIYKRDYWDRVAGDSLAPPLAMMVFDAAVNNGVGRAARWLQAAVGTTQDGQIGPATLRAIQDKAANGGGAALCAEFLAQRTFFMGCLSTWRTFGLGWSRRLAALPFKAMSMGSPS